MAGDITTIARPYAEATFSRAQETEQLDAWGEALVTLSAIVTDPDMSGQIGNPNLPRARLCEAILEVAGETDQGLPPEVGVLLSLLADNDRLSTLPEISRLFTVLRIQHQGIRQVKISSAFELQDETRKELAAVLDKRFEAQVEMTVETDPSLIGGIRIRAGDLVIDGSVRSKLRKLAAELQF